MPSPAALQTFVEGGVFNSLDAYASDGIWGLIGIPIECITIAWGIASVLMQVGSNYGEIAPILPSVALMIVSATDVAIAPILPDGMPTIVGAEMDLQARVPRACD